MIDHELQMRLCIAVAQEARARGDIPVGSTVVRDGHVIASASERLPTRKDPTGHAELLAIQDACKALDTLCLDDCVLYTTAEPCFMCSYAIREARITLVVYGASTAAVGGVTSRHPILTDPDLIGWAPPPAVVGGVLQDDCEALR